MPKTASLVLILCLSVGCAFHAGTITPESEGAQTCKGIYTSFGQTSGPCSMEGGGISLPGSALVSGAFKAASAFASGMFGSTPITINQAQAPLPDKD